MNCKNCGAPLADGAVFCATCGSRTDEPTAQAQPQYQPPQPQYQPQYRPPRQPGQGFLTMGGYALEMISKIASMVVALFALVFFIVALALGSNFFSAFNGLIQGFGLAIVLFVLGQLIFTSEKNRQ